MSVANNLAIKCETTLFECRMRNAKRGTTSLHYVPFTRMIIKTALKGALFMFGVMGLLDLLVFEGEFKSVHTGGGASVA